MNDKGIKYDILTELFNISVGQAACMLSEIVNKKVVLDIPNIEVLDSANQLSQLHLHSQLPADSNGALMVSSITFQEKLTGEANLIFPAEKMKSFVNLCLGEEDEIYVSHMNFTDIDFDVIKEIGNIILNAIVGGIGNHLELELKYASPEVQVFDKDGFEKGLKNKKELCLLLLYIRFGIDNTEIEGAVIVSLTLSALTDLMKTITKIEEGLYE